jgi:HEAT repeat protein
MKTTAALVTFVLACSLCQVRAMADDPIQDARVIGMLSAYESMPSRDEWLALGDGAVPILIGIVGDGEEISFRRVRALTALGYFPDLRALQTLSTWAADTTAPGSLRRAALLALATRDMPRAMPILESVLAASDPLMRQVAVKALAQSSEPGARQLLEDHRAHEQEPFLIEQIESALGTGR